MARFLIEVPHEPELIACARAVEILLKTGSHFLTHADWGVHGRRAQSLDHCGGCRQRGGSWHFASLDAVPSQNCKAKLFHLGGDRRYRPSSPGLGAAAKSMART